MGWVVSRIGLVEQEDWIRSLTTMGFLGLAIEYRTLKHSSGPLIKNLRIDDRGQERSWSFLPTSNCPWILDLFYHFINT
jgi:hypothetical protein